MTTTQETPQRSPRPPRPGRGAERVKSAIAVLIALAMLGGLGGGAYYAVHKAFGKVSTTDDWSGEGTAAQPVTVEKGDTAAVIGRRMKALGVVRTVQAFVDAARADDRSAKIQPGTYRLRKHMGAKDALDLLLDPTARVSIKVVVPEGMTAEEIVALLAKKTKLPQAQFEAALTNPRLGLPSWAGGKAEGFLFPATYAFEPGDKPLAMVQQMVAQARRQFVKLGITDASGAPASGDGGANRAPYDVLRVASMLEKEVNSQEDYGKAARVAYNRLDSHQALGFDSALHYSLGQDVPLTTEIIDGKERDNPYNLRRRPGLPPTPISNPGAATLAAAMDPTPGDWLYFLTIDMKKGTTLFFKTNSEFVAAKAKYGIDY
ncbi:UPF0755 protein [Motilibacter rhizosphaerae]|uniref:Endolytic murein transglycosylase n=1 Tax=Motilibacter rhizosphaerae TaxID=598652 RepID=A0A4Q7NRA1_9ACTN|nr:endolytic transglycosylase MltG [Motilibacter rhizosphaerae]RZS89424.1 UPF0755 protein [Motilibacter rhizosphaerae]